MIRNIGSSFIGGFFRRLGSIFALFFILALVGYLLKDLDTDSLVNKLLGIQKVNASNIDTWSSAWTTSLNSTSSPNNSNGMIFKKQRVRLDSSVATDYVIRHDNFEFNTKFMINQETNLDKFYVQTYYILKYVNGYQFYPNLDFTLQLNYYMGNQIIACTAFNTTNFGIITWSCPVTAFNGRPIDGFYFTTFFKNFNDTNYVTSYSDLEYGFYSNMLMLEYNDNTIINAIDNQTLQNSTKLQEQIDKQTETNNKLNELNQNQQQTNNFLNNSDTSESTSEAEQLFSTEYETHGITGIITAPLNLIQSLLSKTCSPLELPLPFVNENLILPCMLSIYQQNFPTFLTIYQLVISALIGYRICVSVFFMVKDFKNPDSDKIEVLDL